MSGKLPLKLETDFMNGWSCRSVYQTLRARFMRLMNHVFKSFIGHFIVVYFDDILVFSKNVDQHLLHLRQVFTVLREQKLYANASKCHFLPQRLHSLGI